MGGKSSSSQSTNQTDNRRVLAEGAISAENSTVTVQALDAEVANRAFDFGDTVVTKALDFSLDSNAQALDSLQTTTSLVKDAYEDAKGRGALTDKILIGSVVMAGLVALAAIRK